MAILMPDGKFNIFLKKKRVLMGKFAPFPTFSFNSYFFNMYHRVNANNSFVRFCEQLWKMSYFIHGGMVFSIFSTFHLAHHCSYYFQLSSPLLNFSLFSLHFTQLILWLLFFSYLPHPLVIFCFLVHLCILLFPAHS